MSVDLNRAPGRITRPTHQPEWRNGIRSGLKIRLPQGITSSSLVSGTTRNHIGKPGPSGRRHGGPPGPRDLPKLRVLAALRGSSHGTSSPVSWRPSVWRFLTGFAERGCSSSRRSWSSRSASELRPCDQLRHALLLLKIWGQSGRLPGVECSPRAREPLLLRAVASELDVPNQRGEDGHAEHCQADRASSTARPLDERQALGAQAANQLFARRPPRGRTRVQMVPPADRESPTHVRAARAPARGRQHFRCRRGGRSVHDSRTEGRP